MGTKTTTAEVDVDAATKDLETQKVKGDTSTLPSSFAPTLSMDAAGVGNNATSDESTLADVSLATH
jgi:hypothetical protein